MKVAQHIAHRLTGFMDRCGMMAARMTRRGSLRILCYHGICPDSVADQPWIPDYFVKVSQFAEQMKLLGRFGSVVSLRDRFSETTAQNLVEPAFAITFDDVPACTRTHALPILESHGFPASFFIATNHVTHTRLFDADVIRLIRLHPRAVPDSTRNGLAPLLNQPQVLKRLALQRYRNLTGAADLMLRRFLNPTIVETLRPLSWDEVNDVLAAGHEIGCHTSDHAILGSQSPGVRRHQILRSIETLGDTLHSKVVGFAYPNGGPGDFGSQDWLNLQEAGVRYAVTTRSGFAEDYTRFDLPRICIGRGHTRESFILELTGLLDKRRRRQQGWN